MLKISSLFIYILAISINCQSQQLHTLPKKIDVRVFAGNTINDLSFTNLEGKYYIYSEEDDEELNLKKFSSVRIIAKDDMLQVIRMDTIVFEAEKLYLSGHGFANYLLVNPQDTDLPFRIYDDDFIITAEDGNMKIINHVALEKYIAAVVQSEAGFLRHPVYYEVQATITRTYAMKNINRHLNDNHNLCDQVHCQAYYGKTAYLPIIEAVSNSKGAIIVDENNMPVNTVYHANCGGETVNSEDLWGQALPYLRSVKDTFCLDSPGAIWQIKILPEELFDFIEKNFNKKLSLSDKDSIVKFYQISRKQFLDDSNYVHLRHIRSHFGLRSTFFSIELENDSLVFNGKGYGHGVGLCQEGAIKMAELGYTKEQIINYFYYNVNLIYLEE
ncbi:MAG: SpoIID/LytB domain-containing protein [Bacteroidota bacterium]